MFKKESIVKNWAPSMNSFGDTKVGMYIELECCLNVAKSYNKIRIFWICNRFDYTINYIINKETNEQEKSRKRYMVEMELEEKQINQTNMYCIIILKGLRFMVGGFNNNIPASNDPISITLRFKSLYIYLNFKSI